LSLSASDLEVTLQTIIPSETSGSGEVAIKPKTFSDFLRVVSADDVILDLEENNTLKSSCGGFATSHFGISSENFPETLLPDDSEFVTIDAGLLVDAIDKTIYSVTSGDDLYNLKGVYLTKEEELEEQTILRLVSTDAQRLNVASIESNDLSIFPEVGGIIVPRKGLQELRTLCEPLTTVKLGIYDNSLVAKSIDSILKVRLLSGNFPNYHAIIPSEINQQVWINRKNFMETLKRICILIDDKYHLADFTFTDDQLTVASSHPELGHARDSFGIDYQGPEIRTRFNPNFFVDVLSTLKSERLSLQFSEGSASYLLTAPEDPGYRGVIVSISPDS
jgi:DNA polymerase-3 subunit beta